MPDGLTIPFAIETQRHNTVRIPVRNLTMRTGDDITLQVTCYDDCGCPVDISGGAVTLTIVSAPEDPGSGHGWSGYGGIGWVGDYGWGWLTYAHRTVFQQAGTLTNPQCGQADITIPREASACWHGRFRFMVSLATEYGGDVQTYGVLDVRRGPYIARLGTAGLVNIADGFVVPAPPSGVGLLDGIGVVDGTQLAAYPGRIGTLAPLPFTGTGLMDRIGLVDGTLLAFQPGRIGVVPPPASAAAPATMRLSLVLADTTVTGLLDNIGVVDGTTLAFQAGRIGTTAPLPAGATGATGGSTGSTAATGSTSASGATGGGIASTGASGSTSAGSTWGSTAATGSSGATSSGASGSTGATSSGSVSSTGTTIGTGGVTTGGATGTAGGSTGATGSGSTAATGPATGSTGPAATGPATPPYSTAPQEAVFIVTLESAAQQTCIVNWTTLDDTATAPADYTASAGTLTFLPSETAKAIVVPVRPYDNTKQDTSFGVHLYPGNGAIIIQGDATATILGWVGILDDVFVVDGTAAPFVPGLIAVKD